MTGCGGGGLLLEVLESFKVFFDDIGVSNLQSFYYFCSGRVGIQGILNLLQAKLNTALTRF